MASDQIHGEWVETAVRYDGVTLWPEQQEGFAYKGLLLVPAYDAEADAFWPDSWSIWHQASGVGIIDEVRTRLARAMEIAARLTEIADWTDVDRPNMEEAVLKLKLMGFAMEFPLEVAAHNEWLICDFDAIVPYGQNQVPAHAPGSQSEL